MGLVSPGLAKNQNKYTKLNYKMFRKPCILRLRWPRVQNIFSPKHEIPVGITDSCGFSKIGGFTKTLYFTIAVAMSRAGEYNRGIQYKSRFEGFPLGSTKWLAKCFVGRAL
jgi:hypothetical protein